RRRLPADPVLAALPVEVLTFTHRVRFSVGRGGLRVGLGPPLRDEEYGPYATARLRSAYRSMTAPPTDAVLFHPEAAGGGSEQRALLRTLRRRRLDLVCYWGREDLAQTVPEGATPLLVGSAAWYRALASVRYLCSDHDLGFPLHKRAHQRFLRTGTDPQGEPGPRHAARTTTEEGLEGLWDAVVVRSDLAAEQWRRPGGALPVLVAGSLSGDTVLDPEGVAVRDRVRRRLRVESEHTVVMVDLRDRPAAEASAAAVDLARLSRTAGEQVVVWTRSRLRRSARGQGGVVDVSEWSDPAELILAADVALFGDSPLAFDWGLTGKPALALDCPAARLAPADRTLPGLRLATVAEVAAAVPRLVEEGTDPTGWSAFNGSHNAYLDGRAGERVVDWFFA
ncbi:MAG: CDP-glycerol glycerophosphotransferase family protein, partial [Actinomycetes bacterium]